MINTVRLYKKYNVKTGAHPGLQDLVGFGRRKMEVYPSDLYAMILYQVGALQGILKSEGLELTHIKPHGELYFYMLRDATIMRAVLEACALFKVPVYACKNDMQQAMCDELGIVFQQEVYVDIDYDSGGNLVPVAKSLPVTPEICGQRVLRMAQDDKTSAVDGSTVSLGFQGRPFSVCIHSDMATALGNVQKTRESIDQVNNCGK